MITTENAKSLIAQLEREIAAHKARYLKAKADRQQLQKSLYCPCKHKKLQELN